MKLATCEKSGETFIGSVVANDKLVIDLQAAERLLARRERRPSKSCFADMLTLLETGAAGLTAARRATRAVLERLSEPPKPDGKYSHAIRGCRIRAPVPTPRKVLALAGNYQDHIEERGAKMQIQDTQTPRVFMKPPSTTVIGYGDAIQIPPIAQAIDWEGELAVVIGRRTKAVSASSALRYVAGYTIMNDVSERQLHIRDRSGSRPRDEFFDWLNGKWFDTFAPMGPWLVTRDEIPDPQTLEIKTSVNGQLKQHNQTAQMLFPVADIIEYISAMVTLEPGDVISTGTISGVGAATGEFLGAGDRVEVAISQIGVLRNRVRSSRK